MFTSAAPLVTDISPTKPAAIEIIRRPAKLLVTVSRIRLAFKYRYVTTEFLLAEPSRNSLAAPPLRRTVGSNG